MFLGGVVLASMACDNLKVIDIDIIEVVMSCFCAK